MSFNLEATFTGVFISSVLILIICFIAGKNKSFNIFSVDAILVGLGLSMFRAFFPLEYKKSVLIQVPIILTTIFDILRFPVFILESGYKLEFYKILGIVWAIGAIYHLFKFRKINENIIGLLKLIEKITDVIKQM